MSAQCNMLMIRSGTIEETQETSKWAFAVNGENYYYQTQTCPCTCCTISQCQSTCFEAKDNLLSEGQPNEKAGDHSKSCLALLSVGEAYIPDRRVMGFLKLWNNLEVRILLDNEALFGTRYHQIKYVETGVTIWSPLGFYNLWVNRE